MYALHHPACWEHVLATSYALYILVPSIQPIQKLCTCTCTHTHTRLPAIWRSMHLYVLLKNPMYSYTITKPITQNSWLINVMHACTNYKQNCNTHMSTCIIKHIIIVANPPATHLWISTAIAVYWFKTKLYYIVSCICIPWCTSLSWTMHICIAIRMQDRAVIINYACMCMALHTCMCMTHAAIGLTVTDLNFLQSLEWDRLLEAAPLLLHCILILNTPACTCMHASKHVYTHIAC